MRRTILPVGALAIGILATMTVPAAAQSTSCDPALLDQAVAPPTASPAEKPTAVRADAMEAMVSETATKLSRIDTTTGQKIGEIALASDSVIADVTYVDSQTLAVADSGTDSLRFLDTTTSAEVASVALTSDPTSVKLSEDGTRLYVTTKTDLVVVNATLMTVESQVPLPAEGRAPGEGEGQLIVPLPSTGEVLLIDLGTLAILQVKVVGVEPVGVEICDVTAADGAEVPRVLVADREGDRVAVLDSQTLETIDVFTSLDEPREVVRAADYAFIGLDHRVGIFDCATGTIDCEIVLGEPVQGLGAAKEANLSLATTRNGKRLVRIDPPCLAGHPAIDSLERDWSVPGGKVILEGTFPASSAAVLDVDGVALSYSTLTGDGATAAFETPLETPEALLTLSVTHSSISAVLSAGVWFRCSATVFESVSALEGVLRVKQELQQEFGDLDLPPGAQEKLDQAISALETAFAKLQSEDISAALAALVAAADHLAGADALGLSTVKSRRAIAEISQYIVAQPLTELGLILGADHPTLFVPKQEFAIAADDLDAGAYTAAAAGFAASFNDLGPAFEAAEGMPGPSEPPGTPACDPQILESQPTPAPLPEDKPKEGALAVSRDGTQAVVATAPDRLNRVDAVTGETIGQVTLAPGTRVEDAAYLDDGQTLAVADSGTNTLRFVDSVTGTQVAVVPLSAEPTSVRLSDDGSKVFVTTATELAVVDATTKQLVGQVPLPSEGRAAGEGTGKLVIPIPEMGEVVLVDLETLAVIATKVVGVSPVGVEICTATNAGGEAEPRVIVADKDGNRVALLDAQTLDTVDVVAPVEKPASVGDVVDYAFVGLAERIGIFDCATGEMECSIELGEPVEGAKVAPEAGTVVARLRQGRRLVAIDPPCVGIHPKIEEIDRSWAVPGGRLSLEGDFPSGTRVVVEQEGRPLFYLIPTVALGESKATVNLPRGAPEGPLTLSVTQSSQNAVLGIHTWMRCTPALITTTHVWQALELLLFEVMALRSDASLSPTADGFLVEAIVALRDAAAALREGLWEQGLALLGTAMAKLDAAKLAGADTDDARRVLAEIGVYWAYRLKLWSEATLGTSHPTTLQVAALAESAESHLNAGHYSEAIGEAVTIADLIDIILSLLSECSQVAVPGLALSPIVVQVADGQGLPLSGVAVTFEAPAGTKFVVPDSAGGIVETVAGGGNFGDGFPATQAALSGIEDLGGLGAPSGVTRDAEGRIYIADAGHHAIRYIDPATGKIFRAVGSGQYGRPLEGAPATESPLGTPTGIAFDPQGRLVFSDENFHAIFRVTLEGTLERVAGNFGSGPDPIDNSDPLLAQISSPVALAVDELGLIYVLELKIGSVRRIGPAGTETLLTGLGVPRGLALDESGGLLIGETSDSRVLRLDLSTMTVTTLAGTGMQGFSPDGTPALEAQLASPWGVAVLPDGTVIFGEHGSNRVRGIVGGSLVTLAGSGDAGTFPPTVTQGPALEVPLVTPGPVEAMPSGEIVVATIKGGQVWRVSGGQAQVIAGNGTATFFGEGVPAVAANMATPVDVAVDAQGNVYSLDSGRIRRISAADGLIQTLVGGGTEPLSDGLIGTQVRSVFGRRLDIDAAGRLWFLGEDEVWRWTPSTQLVEKQLGIADVSPGSDPAYYRLVGMSIAPQGDLYVATFNKMTASSALYRASVGAPVELLLESANWKERWQPEVDASGTVYLMTPAASASLLRLLPTGTVETLLTLGGQDLEVDDRGNLFVLGVDNRIYYVDTLAKTATPIAGTGESGFAGDGGPALSARFYYPQGIGGRFPDPLYVADSLNDRIRKVDIGSTQLVDRVVGFTNSLGIATSPSIEVTGIVSSDAHFSAEISDRPVYQGPPPAFKIGVICPVVPETPDGEPPTPIPPDCLLTYCDAYVLPPQKGKPPNGCGIPGGGPGPAGPLPDGQPDRIPNLNETILSPRWTPRVSYAQVSLSETPPWAGGPPPGPSSSHHSIAVDSRDAAHIVDALGEGIWYFNSRADLRQANGFSRGIEITGGEGGVSEGVDVGPDDAVHFVWLEGVSSDSLEFPDSLPCSPITKKRDVERVVHRVATQYPQASLSSRMVILTAQEVATKWKCLTPCDPLDLSKPWREETVQDYLMETLYEPHMAVDKYGIPHFAVVRHSYHKYVEIVKIIDPGPSDCEGTRILEMCQCTISEFIAEVLYRKGSGSWQVIRSGTIASKAQYCCTDGCELEGGGIYWSEPCPPPEDEWDCDVLLGPPGNLATSLPSGLGVNIELSPSGGPAHVAWIEAKLPAFAECAEVTPIGVLTPGFVAHWSGGTTSIIAPSLEQVEHLDMDVDTSDAPHFVFGDLEHPSQVLYAKGCVVPQPVNTLAGTFGLVRVDARNRPHIMWTSIGAGAFELSVGYATIPVNVNPGLMTQWRRQEPLPSSTHLGPEIMDMSSLAIDRLGRLHVKLMTAMGYIRMWEPNLGDQDAFLMVSTGPNLRANVGNGNALFTLPLFSSRGRGFATSVSLVYNTLENENTALHPGFSHNYDLRITDNGGMTAVAGAGGWERGPGILWLRLGDGRRVVFTNSEDEPEIYVAEPEYGYSGHIQRFPPLPAPVEKYEFETKFGIVYEFDERGLLKEIRDTQDAQNKMKFTFQDNPLSLAGEVLDSAGVERVLWEIEDSVERKTSVQYGSEDWVTLFKDPAQLPYSMGRVSNELRKVAYPQGGVTWGFAYHQADKWIPGDRRTLLSRVRTPRGVLSVAGGNYFWSLTYQSDNRLLQVEEPKGLFVGENDTTQLTGLLPKFRYRYVEIVPPPPGATLSFPADYPSVEVTNRREDKTIVVYEPRRDLAFQVTDPLEHSIRRIFFGAPGAEDGFRNLATFLDKKFQPTTYQYDPPYSWPNLYAVDNLATITRPGNATTSYLYGPLSRVTSVTDPMNHTTTYTYDESGNLLTITYPAAPVSEVGASLFFPGVLLLPDPANAALFSAVEAFMYDGFGRVLTHTTPRGGVTVYAFDDETGLVASILRPAHAKTEEFNYDEMGNTVLHVLPEGGYTEFDLDGLYRVVKQTESGGDLAPNPPAQPNPADASLLTEPSSADAVTTFVYDSDSNVIKVVDPANQPTEHEYDAWGRVKQTKNAEGNVMKFGYDVEGNTRFVTDLQDPPAFSRTNYDPLNRVSKETRPGPPEQVRELEYDPNGNVVLERLLGAPADRETTREYDVRNNLVETIHPDGATIDRNFYDRNDNLIATYRQGTQTVVVEPPTCPCAGGAPPAIEPGTVLHVITTGSLNIVDSRNRTIRARQILVPAPPFIQDSCDPPSFAVNPCEPAPLWTQEGIEAFAAGQSPPGGTVNTLFGYDLDSDRSVVKDADGSLTGSLFDLADRQVVSVDSLGQPVSAVQYNDNDLRTLAFVRKPMGVLGQPLLDLPWPEDATESAWEWVLSAETDYNERNQAIIVTDALGQQRSSFYNVRGELVATRDELGGVTWFRPDPVGRTTQTDQIVNAGGLTNVTTNPGFDPNGNRTSIMDPKAKEYGFGHDEANRLQSLETPLGFDEQWTYTPFGETQTHEGPDGEVATTTYDIMGRPEEEIHAVPPLAGWPPTVEASHVRRAYDLQGNLTNIVDTVTGVRVERGHDSLGRLGAERTYLNAMDLGSGILWSTVSYTYTAAGNRLSATVEVVGLGTVQQTSYEYDANHRLKRILVGGVEKVKFFYDVAGRRKRIDYAGGLRGEWGYTAREEVKVIDWRKPGMPPQMTARFEYGYSATGNRTSVKYVHLGTTLAATYLPTLNWLAQEAWTGSMKYNAQYAYDEAGNRDWCVRSFGGSNLPGAVGIPLETLDVSNYVTANYLIDDDNRLNAETRAYDLSVPKVLEWVPLAGTAFADSQASNFAVANIADGDTTNSSSPQKAWRSQNAPAQHWGGIQFAQPESVARVTIWVPIETGGGNPAQVGPLFSQGMQRFRVEALMGGVWQPVVTTNYLGAPPNGPIGAVANPQAPGWLKETSPRTRPMEIPFQAVTTTAIRVLMDVGGGVPGIGSMNQMTLNELRAHRAVFQVIGQVATTIQYEYTDSGSLSKRTTRDQNGATMSIETFRYGPASALGPDTRVREYTRTSPGGAVQAHFRYLFSPTGNRIAKINAQTNQGEWFVYDTTDVVCDLARAGTGPFTLTATYVQGLGIDSKMMKITANGTQQNYVTDALGSVHMVTTAGGAVLNRTLTTAWGEVLAETGSAADRHKGLAQRENDEESGMQYTRARLYDPALGRFLASDLLADLKSYRYAGNDPLGLTDPSGLQPRIWDQYMESGLPGEYYDPRSRTMSELWWWRAGVAQGYPHYSYRTTTVPTNEELGLPPGVAISLEREYVLSGYMRGLTPGEATAEFAVTGVALLAGAAFAPEVAGVAGRAAASFVESPVVIAGTVSVTLSPWTPVVVGGLVGGGIVVVEGGGVGDVVTGMGIGALAAYQPGSIRLWRSGRSPAGRTVSIQPLSEEALSGLRPSRSPHVMVVGSETELNALFARLAIGGRPATPATYAGQMVQLPDGTRIGLRLASRSGGPTIDIVFPSGRSVKVHIQQ